MPKKTPDVTYRTEQVEVLLRPVWPEREGTFIVFIRDGYSQLGTFVGSYDKAKDHARYLHSIIRALAGRLNTKGAETGMKMADFE